jgi:hypothetical protein
VIKVQVRIPNFQRSRSFLFLFFSLFAFSHFKKFMVDYHLSISTHTIWYGIVGTILSTVNTPHPHPATIPPFLPCHLPHNIISEWHSLGSSTISS